MPSPSPMPFPEITPHHRIALALAFAGLALSACSNDSPSQPAAANGDAGMAQVEAIQNRSDTDRALRASAARAGNQDAGATEPFGNGQD